MRCARVPVALLAPFLLLACEPMDGNVRVRAEHDLPCAEGHVTVAPAGVRGGKSRFVATGCARSASYLCVVVEETGIPVCEREAAPAP